MKSQLKAERQAHHDQAYFEQFDNFTLVAMGFNLTDDAYDELSHAQDLRLDAETAWNLSASIANANMALRVLVLRLGAGPEEAARAGVRPAGETLQ
ncbi:hypothetical protein GIR22_08490 [Pseudomonas sp. CCM 7891]|uniref:DUF3077 domain-containing protein n=1 Tax=Pseudomonas karstica TaxID=1055468 RepID=A0A7X2RQK3_9PSED|nr:hypothetical protein [Pseudomonas karstica]MTD19188.1 hypothetical protein [Pseudomonas karstica]